MSGRPETHNCNPRITTPKKFRNFAPVDHYGFLAFMVSHTNTFGTDTPLPAHPLRVLQFDPITQIKRKQKDLKDRLSFSREPEISSTV